MFPETSILLGSLLSNVQGKFVLNVGSNTWEHYHDDQHWIWNNILKPLLERGCTILNVDLKKETHNLPKGLTHEEWNAEVGLPYTHAWDIIFCTSMIEHVENPKLVMDNCHGVLREGGIMWLEAPSVYPIHHDPIDNGLRLKSGEEVNLLLKGWNIKSMAFFKSEAPFEGSGVLVKLVKAAKL